MDFRPGIVSSTLSQPPMVESTSPVCSAEVSLSSEHFHFH